VARIRRAVPLGVSGKRYPRLPGHCRVIAPGERVRGPLLEYQLPPTKTPTPSSFLQFAFFIDCSRFCIAHPPPTGKHRCALIATRGHIGRNDLPGQGQRQPHQCLPQWNLHTLGQAVPSTISYAGVVLSLRFLWFPIRCI